MLKAGTVMDATLISINGNLEPPVIKGDKPWLPREHSCEAPVELVDADAARKLGTTAQAAPILRSIVYAGAGRPHPSLGWRTFHHPFGSGGERLLPNWVGRYQRLRQGAEASTARLGREVYVCGFVGLYGYAAADQPIVPSDLMLGANRMATRGPDGSGSWIHGGLPVCLAHRRLAIIDRSDAGLQPMASSDGAVRIVFNGEIYNFCELRRELQSSSVPFRTDTDTEVLIHMYLRFGAGMFSRLRGMFALALWDERDRSMLLARDPFGIKPLFLHDDGSTVRFASQVKALLAGGLSPPAEPAGHVGYWLWGHVPEPWTLYKGITAFPPGHWLKIDAHGGRSSQSFADLSQWLIPEKCEP